MVFIIIVTLHKPSLGLAVLLIGLPSFAQSRRFFSASTTVFSLETLAVFVFWYFTQINDIKSGRKPHPQKERRWFDPLAMVFLFCAALSAMNSTDPVLSLKVFVVGGVAPFLCFSIISKRLDVPDDAQKIVVAVMLIAFQSFSFTLLKSGNFSVQITGEATLNTYDSLYSTRGIGVANMFWVPSGTFSVLVMAIPLSFWYIRFGKQWPSIIGIGSLLSVLIVAILTMSRGTWIAATATLALSIPSLTSNSRGKFVVVFLFIIALLYGSGFWRFATGALDFRLSAEASDKTANARFLNYELALSSTPHYVFYGLGLFNYPEIYDVFPNSLAARHEHMFFAHNLILTLIPEIGLLGTIAFTALFLRSILRGFRYGSAMRDDEIGALIYAIAVGALGYLVVGVTSGTHLVAFNSGEEQFFIAPALIVVFSMFGVMFSLIGQTAQSEETVPATSLIMTPNKHSPTV